jgi:hypothetical protein
MSLRSFLISAHQHLCRPRVSCHHISSYSCLCISDPSHECCLPCQSHLPWCCHSVNVSLRLQIIMLPIMCFSFSLCYVCCGIPLWSKYSPKHATRALSIYEEGSLLGCNSMYVRKQQWWATPRTTEAGNEMFLWSLNFIHTVHHYKPEDILITAISTRMSYPPLFSVVLIVQREDFTPIGSDNVRIINQIGNLWDEIKGRNYLLNHNISLEKL